MTDLTSLTIAQAREKLKAKDISAVELTESYLSAIDAAAVLAVVALILMIGSFIYLSHFSGALPGVDYIPAHFDKNGNFVPGQFK